jgi:predicted TIM-barrel fold metal-dependent hydrolase
MHAHPPYDHERIEPMLEAAWQVGIRRIILAALGFTSPVEYPSADEVRRGNELTYELVRHHPGYVFAYVYVNPNLPETLPILEEGLNQPGVVGIKLWESCRDRNGKLDPVFPVLELAGARRVPVLCHCFYRTGGNLPGELSPSDMVVLAERFPKTRLIMAHLGGKWIQGVNAIKRHSNIWTDFSGTRASMGSVEYAVQELGAERVLFGSDTFFRNPAVMLAKVAAAELAEADQRRIVWDNATRLFFGEG